MRKYLSYLIFGVLVLVVAGLAVNHSRHTRQLVDAMTGGAPNERVAAAKELLAAEQFTDSISGELPAVRVKTAETLELMGDPTAVKQILPLLKDQYKEVRERAAFALMHIGDKTPENFAEMLAGLKDGDGNVRKGTISALTDPAGGIGPKPGVPEAIVAYMKKEGDSRGPGGDVLSSPKFTQGGSNPVAVPLLVAQLSDTDEGVRKGAAEALGKIGDKAAVPKLIELSQKDTAQVQRVAIGALALIADVSAESTLTAAVTNPATNGEARSQAAAGLGKIATPTAVATLIKTLTDDDLKLRSAAIAALARAGRSEAAAPVSASVLTQLDSALRDPSASVRTGAAQALQVIAAPQANPGLIAILDSTQNDPKQRIAAANALGFAGNRAAVAPLIRALNDSDGEVNLAAKNALAAIGPDASDALVAALHSDGPTALYAAQALAGTGTTSLPALEKAAQQGDATTQRWAAVALGELGTAEARPALETLAQSPNADVVFVAKEQLNRLGKLAAN